MKQPDAPFDAPWQAELFGLTVALSDAGHLPWTDWTQAFGAELKRGTDYWPAWLATLQAQMIARGLASADQVHALTHRWQAAARATPHGQPIRLENAD